MKSSWFKMFAVITILALMLVALPMQSARAAGPVSLTALAVPYTQNFDTLPASGSATWTNNSTIPGWFHARTGTGTTIIASNGATTAGGFYSFGTGTAPERALGSIGSGNAAVGNIYWGVRLVNDTGSTINSLEVSYTGEQWRNSAAVAQTVTFSYLIGNPTVTGTLAEFQSAGVAVPALSFTSPITGGTAGALDGNAGANQVLLTFTITGLNIPAGTEIMLRWADPDHASSDHGLSIDNFSVTPYASGSPSGVGTATPDVVARGSTTLLTVAVTAGTNPTSTGLAVTCDLSSIGGSATQPLFDDNTNGDASAGDNTFSFQATVDNSASPGAKSLLCTITDAEARSGSSSISLSVPAYIREIQGASHTSPFSGQSVITNGIVTSVRNNGFNLQDPSPDADDATSEGIFVFTSSAPTVSVGDAIQVAGNVSEFRPGGSSSTNLTTTELTSPVVSVLSSGNSLPAPVVIGIGGRVPPASLIEDDASGSVETSGVFDPATDGIDFYESMEGMLVQVNNPVAVGPTSGFGEIFVLADDGANAATRTARGGIVIQPGDFNPERIQFDDTLTAMPAANVGDHFTTEAVGVLDYSFGNFEVLVTSPLTTVPGGLAREVTAAVDNNHFAVATMNVENLDPTDPGTKFAELAGIIVNNLQSPDILAVEEIQDNNGATNDSVVDASTTFGMLIDAIEAAGGPTYEFRNVDPADDQDGGEPGGNIRVGFLFRTDRGLSFVDRAGATSTTANQVVSGANGPELLYSPGRIDPTNSAFTTSRKPLAAEFIVDGHHLFVVANHFNSKGGDEPLFGRFQPPTLVSETQRLQQAQVVHNFVDNILTLDPNADVIVLGDLNDFEFSAPLNVLKGSPQILHPLIESLPQTERYSYVFEGNSQSLDHILVSNNLFGTPFEYDIVHVNAEFAVQASDHDPQVVRLLSYNFGGFLSPVDSLPTFNTVKAGQSIPVKFSLSGDQGLNIFATGYPASQPIACEAGTPTDVIEETASAGSSGLAYDPATDTYTYIWKTSKSWANSCRQLVVKLTDGTFYRANFKFTK